MVRRVAREKGLRRRRRARRREEMYGEGRGERGEIDREGCFFSFFLSA